MTELSNAYTQTSRCTFAIISHPDAGKTTLTEKFLLYGGAIQMAGTVKGRKASRQAHSDWMKLEQERGISVTTSVMQFPYKNRILNLLDTPGHEDFSEDTYRTLTAVDSALMVVDSVKGVEDRTIKLMNICRMRDTPICTFINKLDRVGKSPVDLLDEIESVLGIYCVPMNWPMGYGSDFKGLYDMVSDKVWLYQKGQGLKAQEAIIIDGLDNPELLSWLDADELESVKDDIALVREALPAFDREAFLRCEQTPVCFGSAMQNIGVDLLLNSFTQHAPGPQSRMTETREVKVDEPKLTGFVFKIQANMDPKHRDRVAFMRICSGKYEKGMKLYSPRLKRQISSSGAMTFFAKEREQVELAVSGDIIGITNHGTIQVGDALTTGEDLKFVGIPHFAPELFRLVRLKDPLKTKQLKKGLIQLSEEGATQVFRPLRNNDLILGAVGVLQFDVVQHRLKHEYQVEAIAEAVNVNLLRWVAPGKNMSQSKWDDFVEKNHLNLALDAHDDMVYLAPSGVNLNLAKERYPDVEFTDTKAI